MAPRPTIEKLEQRVKGQEKEEKNISQVEL